MSLHLSISKGNRMNRTDRLLAIVLELQASAGNDTHNDDAQLGLVTFGGAPLLMCPPTTHPGVGGFSVVPQSISPLFISACQLSTLFLSRVSAPNCLPNNRALSMVITEPVQLARTVHSSNL